MNNELHTIFEYLEDAITNCNTSKLISYSNNEGTLEIYLDDVLYHSVEITHFDSYNENFKKSYFEKVLNFIIGDQT
jgi:hypothetical protein